MNDGGDGALAAATEGVNKARTALDVAAEKLTDATTKLDGYSSALRNAAAALNAAKRDETLLNALQDGYRQHANTLRLWFLVFGVGAPAAFVAREDLFKEFRNLPHFWSISFLFGLGVVVQMTLAFLDKYATAEWFFKRVTANERSDPPATESLLVERDTWFWAKCWLQQNWLSAIGDALTVTAFVIASLLALSGLTPPAP